MIVERVSKMDEVPIITHNVRDLSCRSSYMFQENHIGYRRSGDDRKYEQASQFGTTPKNGYNPIKLWFDLDESDGSPSSSVS